LGFLLFFALLTRPLLPLTLTASDVLQTLQQR